MGEVALKNFRKILSQYKLILLDSSCFIYHIEENPVYIALTEVIFEQMLPENRFKAICSTLLLTEILTRPMAEKRQDLVLTYKSIIVSFPNLMLKPFDETVAQTAAYFRAEYNLKTPDAIHIATAHQTGAEAIICNDTAWKKVKEIPVIILSEFIR